MFAYQRSLHHIHISAMNCPYLTIPHLIPEAKRTKKESSDTSRTILLIFGLILFMRAAALHFSAPPYRYRRKNSRG